jgi:type II secretory pathway pseudopilin PulG
MKIRNQTTQRGFTLVEMLLATVVVIVGLVAVAQLVPTSVMRNMNNRNDGTALVFAQRAIEFIREQPLTTTSTPPSFTDPLGVLCPPSQTCLLGDPNQPNVMVGSDLNTSGTPMINFSATPVPGYNYTYIDPNDPYGAAYDVRWAISTAGIGGTITGRRIILGVFRRGMKSASLPVTLDTLVER